MQITLPFFAFTSLNSLPYVHHPEKPEKSDESRFSGFLDCDEELNYLIPRVQEKTETETKQNNDVSV
jgi:hypothetical protein